MTLSERILFLMQDGKYRTAREIHTDIGHTNYSGLQSRLFILKKEGKVMMIPKKMPERPLYVKAS